MRAAADVWEIFLNLRSEKKTENAVTEQSSNSCQGKEENSP